MATKKAPPKKAAEKKEVPKKPASRKLAPSKALVRDLAAVLEAHNWSGVGIRLAEGAESAFTLGVRRCPEGKVPVEFIFEDDQGNQVKRTVCVDRA